MITGLMENGTVTDKSEFVLELPDSNLRIEIQEGSGCNLTNEDRENGFVDYIDYTGYSTLTEEEEIGGQVLLRTYYAELDIEQIIEEVLDIEDLSREQTMICSDLE